MATVDRLEITKATVDRPPSGAAARQSRFASIVSRVDPDWWKYLLIASDMLLILIAMIVAYYVRYQLQWFRSVDPAYQIGLLAYTPFALALVIVLPFSFRFSNVYPYRNGRSLVEEVYHIATATTVGVVILITLNLIFSTLLYSRLIFLYAAILITIFLGASRFAIQRARAHLRQYGIGVNHVLLVGVGDVGRMVIRNIAARPDLGYGLVGFIDDNPVKSSTDIGPFRALGPVDNFEAVVSQDKVDSVIICLPWQSHRTIQRLLRHCEQIEVRAWVVPDLFQLTKNQMQVEQLNGIPLISTRDVSIIGWNLFVKRLSDLILASIGAIICLPIGLLIALAIRIDSKGPVLYAQTRVGKDGKEFCCYKFRSMIVGAEQMRGEIAQLNEASGPLFKVRDDPRRTRVGRFLRRYSLDELPQLINVLRGEMSMVGPRPNLPDEVAHYKEWHQRRLTSSPGITGLWQVSGRSDLTFDEMVLLDIYYVENWSLSMDLGILLRSIPAVLRGRGAY